MILVGKLFIQCAFSPVTDDCRRGQKQHKRRKGKPDQTLHQ